MSESQAADEPTFILREERNRHVIDGVRAVGILLVVLFHTVLGLSQLLPEAGLDDFIATFPSTLNIAWQALGSEIIFFGSGFLLSYLLFKEHVANGKLDLHDFFVRRISRILPLYFVALLLYAAADEFDVDLDQLLLNLLFVSKIFGESTIIPVGWSLELMMQMYVLLPFLVMWVMRTRFPVFVMTTLVVLSIAARAVALLAEPGAAEVPLYAFLHGADVPDVMADLYHLTWFRATPFLLGLLFAWLTIFRGRASRATLGHTGLAHALILGGLALVAVAGSLPLQDEHSFLYNPALGAIFWITFWTFQRFALVLGICLMLMPCFYATHGLPLACARVLAWKPWGHVSRNIYSVYLFHQAFLIPGAALAFWTTDADDVTTAATWQALVIFAVGAVLSVLFARLMTRWVELPSQRFLRDRWQRTA